MHVNLHNHNQFPLVAVQIVGGGAVFIVLVVV